MNERLTPETDAEVSVGLENADRECVPADFAQKLERERDHWKKIASAFEVLMPPVGGKRILKIIERDGWKCAYCGVETCFNGWDGPMPTVDHITPKAKGGLDHIANCVVACKDCNSAKSDQENWSPNSGEQKKKKTWAWEDGKFRKKTEK
jgi:CRISPR/Cas system Type II protein with McrA/HNH and RuvC-like nuclease domain